MKSMLDRFLEEITHGLYDQPTSGTYTPTLVVGLGGTGLKALRYLKKALNRHQTQAIRLLGIDSDKMEPHAFRDRFPELDDSELVLLDPTAAVRAMARAEKGMPGTEHVKAFLPETHAQLPAAYQSIRNKITLGVGAGQLRRSGKLLFCANVNDGVNVNQTLREVKRELLGLRATLERKIENYAVMDGTRIFVISSLAGGTGAGCLVDFLALLRSHFDGDTDKITAICLLPGPALDNELRNPRAERGNTRGNAIAALRELQACMLGGMSRHTFTFDASTKYTPGSTNLVNSVYLVGDTQMDGRVVESWFDLCQATAHFLYGIVGTGIGASAESGAINHDVNDEARMRPIPGIFSALGVGVVEYPIDEIGGYAFCRTVGGLLDEWLNPKFDKKDAESQFTQLCAELQIESLADVEAMYSESVGSISDARFLTSELERKTALRKDDVPFIGAAEAKINGIDGQLSAYDDQLAVDSQALVRDIQLKLDESARRMITNNVEATLVVLGKIVAKMKDLREEFNTAYRERKQEQDEVLQKIDDLKAEVHRKDILWSDHKARKRLIQTVNRYLDLRVKARLEQHIAGVLTTLQHTSRELYEKVSALRDHLDNLRMSTAAKLEELNQRESIPGFVIHAMSMKDIPAWADELKISVRKDFLAADFDPVSLIRQAVPEVEPCIRTGLKALNLVVDSKRNTAEGKELTRKLKAMGDSSRPLIKLQAASPGENEMQPQLFVVSNQSAELMNHFRAPPEGNLTNIELRNTHFAVCVTTLNEFGFEDWAEYEHAVGYYKQKPWYYHALPDSAALPPLGGAG
jgi:hypothetical protein